MKDQRLKAMDLRLKDLGLVCAIQLPCKLNGKSTRFFTHVGSSQCLMENAFIDGRQESIHFFSLLLTSHFRGKGNAISSSMACALILSSVMGQWCMNLHFRYLGISDIAMDHICGGPHQLCWWPNHELLQWRLLKQWIWKLFLDSIGICDFSRSKVFVQSDLHLGSYISGPSTGPRLGSKPNCNSFLRTSDIHSWIQPFKSSGARSWSYLKSGNFIKNKRIAEIATNKRDDKTQPYQGWRSHSTHILQISKYTNPCPL